MKPAINLKLDSGAYSAFTSGKSIDLEKYCDFILANQEHLYSSVALDVIDPNDPETAAKGSYDNFTYMLKRGIRPVPVFHAREGVAWLDKMLLDAPYIGISGTSIVSRKENLGWHELVWNHITDKQGNARVLTHAFGDTSPFLMTAYPFFSADSATWAHAGGKDGSIYIGGKRYQLRTNTVHGASYISLEDKQHSRDAWIADIRSRGIDAEKLMTAELRPVDLIMFRCFLNCFYMFELQKMSTGVRSYKKPAFLINGEDSGLPGKPREADMVKLFAVFTSSMMSYALPIFTVLGITDVLCSYFYLGEKQWPQLQAWMYDPEGECQRNPRLNKYWTLLQSFLLEPSCK